VVIISVILWIDISILDIIKLKLEEKRDSILVFDLDDIICSGWILWFKSMNICYSIILPCSGVFRRTSKNMSH
jgi:hypothetical protein